MRRLLLTGVFVAVTVALGWTVGQDAAGSTASVGGSLTERTDGKPGEHAVQPGISGSLRGLKDPKLSTQLVLLADAAARAEAAGRPLTASSAPDAFPRELRGMLSTRNMRLSDDGGVQVFIFVDGASDSLLDALEAQGARIQRVEDDLDIVQADVPAGALRDVAALRGVEHVRLPNYPARNAGSIVTEGDAIMQSDDVRALGPDGSGVTVGVISDGAAGLAASVASGDLPMGVNTSTCNVVSDSPTAPEAGAEGTAMMEIVHDIAPGADLMFGHFGFGYDGTVLDFNDAVDCLAANADVVVDDIAWFGVGPYDGTSFVSENTADALNSPGPIRGYFTSVGNQAGDHYQESYDYSGITIDGGDILPPDIPPSETWDLHDFSSTGGPKGTVHSGGGPDPNFFNSIVLAPGGSASFIVMWDDPWGGSGNDYDLFFGDGVNIFICGGDPQDGNDFPIESCGIDNPIDVDIVVDIFIGNYLGEADTVEFDMFILCNGCDRYPNGASLDFATSGSSVPNQADAGGSPASVISVGAVPQSSPNSIEPFSSRGLAEDGRLKPDVSAPDGVCITGNGGFGSGSCQGSGKRFFGTSAAAPHAAGVAALLIDCDPSLSRLGMHDRLLKTAVDLGAPGADNTFGYGRINAIAAKNAGSCGGAPATATNTPIPTTAATPTNTSTPIDTPTPTNTPTRTPTPTPSNTPTRTPTPTPPCLRGDVNGDGLVNAVDSTLILQLSAGLLRALRCESGADVSDDGLVNAVDSTLILQFVAGLISGFR